MNTLSYKTVSVNKENADKQWLVIDAEDEVLGRLASATAKFLRGKHKACFTPHSDCGDNVIILNAEKIRLTGKKEETKYYIRHTGYPGGQRVRTFKQQMAKKPETVIEHAVKGMLPKTKLGAELFRNLYVYAGTEHKHEAQKPKVVNLKSII
jgi:large subunit ribosomal protein L13